MKEMNDKNVKTGNSNLQCVYNIIDKGPVIHQLTEICTLKM